MMKMIPNLGCVLVMSPAFLVTCAQAVGFQAVSATRSPPDTSSADMDVNISASSEEIVCSTTVPYMSQVIFSLGHLPLARQIWYGVNAVFLICTWLIFIESCIFCKKAFKNNVERRRRTIWINGFWPVLSLSGFLGIMIPRSAPIVDLIAGAYLGTVLFQVVELLVGYMGGKKNMWAIMEPKKKQIPAQSLPLCCFCPCLPFYVFTRQRYNRLLFVVFQLSIVRPFLLFITSALWANGSYLPGVVSLTNAFAYVKTITIVSTVSSMYAIAQIRNGFIPELMGVNVIGKVTAVQSTVMLTIVVEIIISICLATGAVPCTPLLPAFVNASNIFHATMMTVCFPLALMARKNYRCISDAMWKTPEPPADSNENLPLTSPDEKQPNGKQEQPAPPARKCAIFRP